MILFKILGTLVVLIAIFLIIALFVKKKYTITRETTIKSSVEDVYDYLRFQRNQKYHNHWLLLDPNAKIETKGEEDGKPGSILSFESKSKKTGTGEWENIRLIENERIEWELRFLHPYHFTATAVLSFKPINAHETQLVWEYHSGMDWPKNITLLFMDMDKIIGTDIETTLDNIKQQLENNLLQRRD